jgi:hypothetical protein
MSPWRTSPYDVQRSMQWFRPKVPKQADVATFRGLSRSGFLLKAFARLLYPVWLYARAQWPGLMLGSLINFERYGD